MRQQSESIIQTHEIGRGEAAALVDVASPIGAMFGAAHAPDQLRLAQLAAAATRLAAPRLATYVGAEPDKSTISRIQGVPVGHGADPVLATILALLRGEIFQYSEQLDGRLTAPIRPIAGSAPNSNSSADPFCWHTDDAIMPARFRVEQISLLGIMNPAGTMTGFARLADVLAPGGIGEAAREILEQPRFNIASPNAFALDGRRWIEGVPILFRDRCGRAEIAFPSYNTRPTWTGDMEAQRALEVLVEALDEVAVDVHIAPGEWLVWDNATFVHRRGAIGDGPRELWRNYIRRDCSDMRAATGNGGPIFSALQLLSSVEACRVA